MAEATERRGAPSSALERQAALVALVRAGARELAPFAARRRWQLGELPAQFRLVFELYPALSLLLSELQARCGRSERWKLKMTNLIAPRPPRLLTALRSLPLPRLLLLLVLLPAPPAAAQFTQITDSFLTGVADPADGFGAEDKLAICNGDLVFVDLDDGVDLSNNYRFIYRPATGAWAKDGLTSSACPDSNQGNLIPRETGYVVGTARSPFGGDRLLVLGGASTTTEPRHIENNVYYSDDCGLTWRCYDGQQARIPRADQSHYRPGTNSLI